MSTWTAVLGAALAVATVIFSAGDARQTLVSQGAAIARNDSRIGSLEHDVSDMKIMLARIDQSSADTRATVHRLERGHVYTKAGD